VKIFALLARAPRFVSLGLAACAVLLAACSQTPVTVTLHSLQASGALSFVCQSDEGHVGLKLDECPDYEHEHRRILGLVTQTATDEVAIVDLRGQSVVDVDPATPGYTFLRVGATPGAIVSTPGGVASFVGVKGLQKNGIFALPTTCLAPPSAGQQARDLTSWAACALSSAPGDIKVLIDPTASDSGVARAACPGTPPPPAASPHECSADLTTEDGPFGRRKLLVALPEEHRLVLLDAQNLLDRPAGEFQACTIEVSYPLDAKLPSEPVEPVLPEDLQGASGSQCDVTKYPAAIGGTPTPAGMALSGSNLYVADSSLPVVHVVDVTDPCAPAERDPLLPHSYLSPSRVVTTSRVAVSPLTPAGKQFVYAIDHNDQPSASVMVFDVSPNSTNRTPLVFPGSPRQPFSAPDRLRFGSPVRDVGFVMRDFPAPDPNTGVGQFGLQCDPSPGLPTDSPAAQYRPNADFTSGARPVNLRGVFGFAMLDNGQIPIIDVEDFDAPCRRPVSGNPSSVEDFRGCKHDPSASFTSDTTGQPTVTGETSCNMIEPNRARSAFLSVSSSSVGLHGPTLRALPQFSNPDPAAAIVPQDQPHLLAVDFMNAAGVTFPAQVNVSGQLYAACPAGTNTPPCNSSPQALLNDPGMDPATANQNSLTLPLVEPRSYAGDESPTVTYEGRVFQPPLTDRTSGFIQRQSDGWWLRDPDAIFCSSGVEDAQAMASEADELGIPSADQPAWTKAHADYVQITGDFLPSDDDYWRIGRGQFCHDSGSGSTVTGRDACVTEFGGIDNPTNLKDTRELSIVHAYTDHLVVEPRNGSTVEEVQCCFPTGTAYTVRASHQWIVSGTSGLSDIAASKADGSCVHTASCDLRKKYFHSRVFEVCNSGVTPPAETAPADLCQAGAANIGCMHDFGSGPINPSKDDGSRCIFENLTSRFVVYRGAQPSTRDMQFTWSTTGGFSPLSLSLLTQSTAVNPQSMVYVPELGYLAVVDGSTLGLALFDLNSLGVVTPSPYF
jgi:hypothetical protein